MKRILMVVISLMLLIMVMTSCTSNTTTNVPSATSTLKIGDYVQMGKYFEEPILWRCVDIDENGPLMLSDKIITLKAFDANGTHKYLDGTTQADPNGSRISIGSDLWQTSNIRSWLNSSATAGNVTWLDGCPPTKETIYNEWNDYASEKGFLADGNFSAGERSVIKSVNQKSLLNPIDATKLSSGGSAGHIYDENISTVIQNYDKAYYHNVTDKMFLLDVKQANKAYQNSIKLGMNYYIGKLTQKAVDNSEDYKEYLNTSINRFYWLRSPVANADKGISVRTVGIDGSVGYSGADLSNSGVRPAFYIDLSSANLLSGSGTGNDPFVVKSSNTEANTPIVGTKVPTNASTNAPTRIPSVSSTLKVGEYIQIGKYYDEPIIWRCVDIDENGPLMLSDKILTLKAFDAQGTHKYMDGTLQADDASRNRNQYGSNLWETSNIRSWLNSRATAGAVKWPDGCPPDAESVYEGKNAYASEKGFLAEGNFSKGEITAIKSVTQKQLLNELDKAKLKTSGSEGHISNYLIESVLKNYDSAYAYTLSDKVFLLDVEQLSKVYQNGDILGAGYYNAKITQKGVEKSEWEGTSNGLPLNTNSYWPYWLRSPVSSKINGGEKVRKVDNGFVSFYGYAGDNTAGVRPAFYLDLQSAIFKSGTGTENDPFVVKS